jgi:hypothetical protein
MLIRPLSLLDYFVAVVMFSIGLRVSGGELLNVWHRRGLFARMLLANCILIPALGFLLVHVFPFNPEGKDWHLAVSRHSWNTDRLTVHTARYCFPQTHVFPLVYLALMVPKNLIFHLGWFAGWQKMWPAEKNVVQLRLHKN